MPKVTELELGADGTYGDGISIPKPPRTVPAARFVGIQARKNPWVKPLTLAAAAIATLAVGGIAEAGIINIGLNSGKGPRYSFMQSTKIGIDAALGTNLSAPTKPQPPVEVWTADPANPTQWKATPLKPGSRI